MKKITIALAVLTSWGAFAQGAPWLADARKVAISVPPKLLQVLSEEIAKGGPESAIEVCRERAPKMAKAASDETGWAVRRVSLRNRNPKAVPDDWERAALEDFDRRAVAGENTAAMEKGEVVSAGDKKEYRYMRALPVQQLCLSCHGAPQTLKPEVVAQLKKLYPDDKGVGYDVGQIRGAMTIRKAL